MKSSLKTYITVITIIMITGCSRCADAGKKEKRNDRGGSREKNSGDKTIIKMEKIDGVYQIPVEVNGVKMYFIFDTGASIISISETEAIFLWKQGLLSEDDIKGTERFSDANGDISEGTIINLSTVNIGGRVLKNIEASVVNNSSAPLLFGQSALNKFGKISIDYNKEEIVFE